MPTQASERAALGAAIFASVMSMLLAVWGVVLEVREWRESRLR